jgi:hypothetical protein
MNKNKINSATELKVNIKAFGHSQETIIKISE